MNERIKYQIRIPMPNGIGNRHIGFFTLVGARALAQAYGVKNIWDCANDCYLEAEVPKVAEPDLDLIVDVLSLDPLDINRGLSNRVYAEYGPICQRINELRKTKTNNLIGACVHVAKVEWLKAKLLTV